ncbi:MAG: tetratricopeptide repeat protein [Thermoleophilia bacterium]|nr:tetratricopeptide repeat protein [Thermoleophilia bacterium]
MSPRTRTVVVVAAVAVAAAAASVGGALVQGREAGGEAHAPAGERERPALELAALAPDEGGLREGERLYETGRVAEARRRFASVLARKPDSVAAEVGLAFAGGGPALVRRLRAIAERHPASGVARLNLGLALLSAGELELARREWRRAERVDPDSPAAIRADDLLNPRSPPGRPLFVAPLSVPASLLSEAAGGQAGVAARGRDPARLLRLGIAYLRLGRPLSARRAFDRAAQLAPADLRAQVGAAIARFQKDAPAATFSRLGRLAGRHPRAPIVRYHLGLALLYLPNLEEARVQLRRARGDDPKGFYGREAARILDRLGGVE